MHPLKGEIFGWTYSRYSGWSYRLLYRLLVVLKEVVNQYRKANTSLVLCDRVFVKSDSKRGSHFNYCKRRRNYDA